MRTLLYGGTFDPPHLGHLNNLRAAAEAVSPQRILVMPAGVPPHKHASATPAALRLEMCRCFERLARPGREVVLSDWEIRQAEAGRHNYSVLTLRMLRERFPEDSLFLTVGSDMLCSFSEWYRWEEILSLAELVVVSRETGDDAALLCHAEALRSAGGRVHLARAEALPMASSGLRARLAAGEDCTDSLPQEALAVISREKLYRPPTGIILN